jgi:CheY-like chemotaxis protein
MQRDLYAMVLEDAVDVLTASRVEEAYELAVSRLPDVVVVDVLLPDGDGLTLCARLRAHAGTANVPLIAISGDDAAQARADQAPGLVAVLAKPCPADKLLRIIEQALTLRSGKPSRP